MFQEEDPLLRRLKELSLITKPTEKEFAELEQIKKDLCMDQDTSDNSEPIPQIKNYRHQLAENRKNEEQLRLLVQQRKEIEKIKELEQQIDGYEFCKTCEKMVDPKTHYSEKIYCDDCEKLQDHKHFE